MVVRFSSMITWFSYLKTNFSLNLIIRFLSRFYIKKYTFLGHSGCSNFLFILVFVCLRILSFHRLSRLRCKLSIPLVDSNLTNDFQCEISRLHDEFKYRRLNNSSSEIICKRNIEKKRTLS